VATRRRGGTTGRTAPASPGRWRAALALGAAWAILAAAPAAPNTNPAALCAGRPATIVGTDGDDEIRGTPGDDVIAAGRGADRVWGGPGTDLVCAGPGHDIVHGGAGPDWLRGGGGRDLLIGGGGSDTLQGGPRDDDLSGGDGDDRLFGGADDDYLAGDAGHDTLRGDEGRDRCHGGEGRDRAAACEAVAATETGQPAEALLDPGPGRVALTFDDGPSGLYGPRLLDILARYGVPGTFFVVGERAEARPDLVRRMVAEGHSVQSHSYTHHRLTLYPDATVVDQLARANEAITATAGEPPLCLRPPYLAVDSRVRHLAASLGLATVMTDVNPQDWRRPGAAAITSYVLGHTGGGDIVSLHEGTGEDTLQALPAIIEGLRARGLEFVAICSTATWRPTGLAASSDG